MVEANKDKCPYCTRNRSAEQYLVKRSASGSSVVMVLLTTSVTVVSTMLSHPARMLTSSFLILRFTPTQAVSLQRLLQWVPSLSSLHAGKRVRKKDLGLMATTYGYVYVAQIAMGADHAQTSEGYPRS
jgi:pyruvate-ferredoxin/flavodoxin oxidoreductase